MSLLSPHKSSDSGLSVGLHPLVLLTISDYITRHTLQRQTQPIVGALIGQQDGRIISLENAFELRIIPDDDGNSAIHDEYFKERLAQYKEVHASPQLELVGWFTTAPATGPEALHGTLHEFILQNYNEAAILLAFHPSRALASQSSEGTLPLTVYESLYESVGDSIDAMDTGEKEAGLELRFRELPYTIESGEAERIGVDFVARGGGNATAVESATETKAKPSSASQKGGASKTEGDAQQNADRLSPQDEAMIASLTARINAIKMLHARIQLIQSYLEALPPSYLTTSADASAPSNGAVNTTEGPDFCLLRSIQALLSRLPLLLPSGDLSAFTQGTLSEKSEVELISLLGLVSQGTKDASELGRKFSFIERGKSSAKRAGTFGQPDGGFDAGPENEAGIVNSGLRPQTFT